jgi:hypothetical protein
MEFLQLLVEILFDSSVNLPYKEVENILAVWRDYICLWTMHFFCHPSIQSWWNEVFSKVVHKNQDWLSLLCFCFHTCKAWCTQMNELNLCIGM